MLYILFGRYAGMCMYQLRNGIIGLLRQVLRLALVCCAATGVNSCGPDRSNENAERYSQYIWDFASRLSDTQRQLNAQVYKSLPPDECDAENGFDSLAYDLATQGTPEALRALRALEHGGGRERQAAAGRAYLFIAQQQLAIGNRKLAAEHALHIFLSGVPHRLRLEALRVYCSSASPEQSIRWIELIAAGVQDAAFTPVLEELRAARLAVLQQK